MFYKRILRPRSTEPLHAIVAYSNPCGFRRRTELMRQFLQRMEETETRSIYGTRLRTYVVELVYGDAEWEVTDSNNPRHLQLRLPADEPLLWMNENLVNIGIAELLPVDWKVVAWIDWDLEFDNWHWVEDCMLLLDNGDPPARDGSGFDILQLFSHCVDMDVDESAVQIHTSLGYQAVNGVECSPGGVNFGHTGYAWACTRAAYEKLGRLFDKCILGNGDTVIAFSVMESAKSPISLSSTRGYLDTVDSYRSKAKGMRLGYVPGVLRRYFHGRKASRRHMDRWKILTRGKYDPCKHVYYDEYGLIRATHDFPVEMAVKIREYFFSRKEDEFTYSFSAPSSPDSPDTSLISKMKVHKLTHQLLMSVPVPLHVPVPVFVPVPPEQEQSTANPEPPEPLIEKNLENIQPPAPVPEQEQSTANPEPTEPPKPPIEKNLENIRPPVPVQTQQIRPTVNRKNAMGRMFSK
jgi:hypothetical protein